MTCSNLDLDRPWNSLGCGFFFSSNFQNSGSGWFGNFFHSRWFVLFWISTNFSVERVTCPNKDNVAVGKGVPIFPWNVVHKIFLIHRTGLAYIDFLLSVQDVPMIQSHSSIQSRPPCLTRYDCHISSSRSHVVKLVSPLSSGKLGLM